jgi:general secretion pathway protein H
MQIWTAEICDGEWEKRGTGETGKGRNAFSLFAASPLRRFADSLVLLPPRAGFTLLELSLVLFILGLLTTILIPRLGDLDGARLEASAKRLAALARYLNGEAAFRGHVYRLSYDFNQRTYAVQVLRPSRETADFVLDQSPLSRPVQLPANITFADIRVPSRGRVNTGQVFTHFYPQGYTDPTVIHLRDRRDRIATVMIPPITGEAQVYEGYVDAFRR